eukprot:g38204.t1
MHRHSLEQQAALSVTVEVPNSFTCPLACDAKVQVKEAVRPEEVAPVTCDLSRLGDAMQIPKWNKLLATKLSRALTSMGSR